MNKKKKGLLLPAYYIIESTNKCNFSCSICPNSFYRAEKGCMDIKLLEKILLQISPFAEVIQLYWMGEPLLDELIFDKIKLCKHLTKAKVILSTNGSKLKENNVILLRDSGLDEIIVSIDACDSQEIYEKIRVGGNLYRLQKNIEILMKNRGKMKVVLQFIDMYVNKSEMVGFLEKWGDYKTEISPLYTWAKQIPALILASDNYHRIRTKKRKPCSDLWQKMSIHWNGDVSICCFDFADKIHFGNCNDQYLDEIWNGEVAEKIRLQHKNGKFEGLCETCIEWAEPDEYIEMYHLN